MQELSYRLNLLSVSATLAMAEKARKLQSQGIEIIKLNLGEPDFPTPVHIQEAAIKAIQSGKYFAYPPVSGYADLREAIASKLKRENGLDYRADDILVSTGAKQSIANVLLSLLNPGDEVIVFAPYWVSYSEQVKLAEATPVFVKGTLKNDFKVSPEQLRQAITPKTKAVLYSSPCNPTGSVFTQDELIKLAEVLADHPKICVISDEIYEHINFGHAHSSMASVDFMKPRTVVVNGFSKGYAMTGWRVGYIAAPPEITKACNKLQGQITSATCSIAQRAALAALEGGLESSRAMCVAYLRRRDLIKKELDQIEGIKTNTPQGAFYIFPDVRAFFGKSDGEITIKSSDDLALYLLKKAHVSLVAGTAFGAPNYLRLSFAATDDMLKEAAHKIKIALSALK